MTFNFSLLKTVFLRPGPIAILVIASSLAGAGALKYCRSVKPRYSVAALYEAAEAGDVQAASDPRDSLFNSKLSSDIKLDALAFLDFEYLSGNRNANGVTLTEAKDQKSTNLIQVMAEGYTNETIELFLGKVLDDLKSRYETKLDGAREHAQSQLDFMNKQILSLETFKIQVTTAIEQVGPSPVLGSQLIDINRDLNKLKQDYFAQKAGLSIEKIHNFKLTSVRAVGGGAPVFPKSKPTILFSMFVTFITSAYAIFLHYLWRSKKFVVTANQAHQTQPKPGPVTRPGNYVEATQPEQSVAAKEAKEPTQIFEHVNGEIRSPLHDILGMTGILLSGSLTKEQKEYANSVRISANSMLALVNDLLILNAEDNKPNFVEVLPFGVRDFIENVVEHLPRSHAGGSGTITYDLAEDLRSAFVIGERGKLELILTHLTSNAIKFSRNHCAHIRITKKDENENQMTLRFEVIDSGAGIPAHTLTRIFEAFGDDAISPARKFGGSGIGLAVAKRLVNTLNGQIGVESLIGIGSKFWFTVSLKIGEDDEQARDNVTRLVSGQPSGVKYRILLADDNIMNQQIATHMLEKAGHHVDVASDGNEALDALRVLPYDLILMDCHMPELDGYEATRIIRTSKSIPQRNIPIIAVTSYTSQKSRSRCLEAGMDDFLAKPFKFEHLVGVINNVMTTKEQSA